MKTRTVSADETALAEVVRTALASGPQALALEDGGEAVVLDAAEYARLTDDAMEHDESAPTRLSAAGSADVDDDAGRRWVWEWDARRGAWALPWADAADPAAHPGLPLLDFMQNSPLAEAFRAGEIDEDAWDAACRIGR